MPFLPGNPGGPGRPKKVIEDAQHSVLLEIFDAAAERKVVKAQLKAAYAGDTTAATWLWDRKYGKVRERVEHSGGVEIFVTYAADYVDDAAPAPDAAGGTADGEAV